MGVPAEIAAPLMVSHGQRADLEWMAAWPWLPYRVVVQAPELLLAADGESNGGLARPCETTTETVQRWRAKLKAGDLVRSALSLRVVAVDRVFPRAWATR